MCTYYAIDFAEHPYSAVAFAEVTPQLLSGMFWPLGTTAMQSASVVVIGVRIFSACRSTYLGSQLTWNTVVNVIAAVVIDPQQDNHFYFLGSFKVYIAVNDFFVEFLYLFSLVNSRRRVLHGVYVNWPQTSGHTVDQWRLPAADVRPMLTIVVVREIMPEGTPYLVGCVVTGVRANSLPIAECQRSVGAHWVPGHGHHCTPHGAIVVCWAAVCIPGRSRCCLPNRVV